MFFPLLADADFLTLSVIVHFWKIAFKDELPLAHLMSYPTLLMLYSYNYTKCLFSLVICQRFAERLDGHPSGLRPTAGAFNHAPSSAGPGISYRL